MLPAAIETDRADAVPLELLDALADAGLYGLAGPTSAGGLDADFQTVCNAVEARTTGRPTTTFVWAQHLGAVRAVAASGNETIGGWLGDLCSGKRRAGLALGGALSGPPRLTATDADGGWIFHGSSPFVSGWTRIDVIHTAARTPDGRLVWALVDATESDALAVERLDLVALNATATVKADFRRHRVPAGLVTSVDAYREGPAPVEVIRFHASFALGVAARCCRILGRTRLDGELERVRADLDELEPRTIEAARGAAGELALRAAAALAVVAGSRSLLVADHAQRLAREALFTLVYALRPGSRNAVFARLAGGA